MLEWMDSPDSVIDLATLYLKVYFLGMPATMVYNFGAAILRAAGDTKTPLIFLTIAGVINVLLNLCLNWSNRRFTQIYIYFCDTIFINTTNIRCCRNIFY